MYPLLKKTGEIIWERLRNTHSRPPSPSVDLRGPGAGGTTHSDTIQAKTIDQQPGTSTEGSNVGLTIADQQKPSTSDPDVVESVNPDQQPNDTESIDIKSPPRLFALIIGINNYESSKIRNLLGAVPDADAVRDYLQKHLGVPSSQIRNLRDNEATRSAIINEIKALSHNDNIKVGDPIMIYYAGHGGSAKTPKGWQAGGTKIQLLVPCDCSDIDVAEQKQVVPDRTLGVLLSRLASKKGDNITVILDCCHSGSGTRNNDTDSTELVRGIDLTNVPSELDRDVWEEFESSNRGAEVNAGFVHGGLRSHVLLAACTAEESALERKSRGLFTQGLLEVLTTFGIDKLTYTSLLQRMSRLPSKQNPQCEGVNQHRIIFDGKAPAKSIIYYKIREEGEGYVMPDVGSASGAFTLGAEFEVYQDQDSGPLLGIVVATKLSPFSATLEAKGSKFALEKDGVALLISAGIEKHALRIHVADEGLKEIVRKVEMTDPSQRVELVERNQAEFGMALENGKVVFDILDSEVTKHGLTRMPYTLEPTLDDISPIICGAYHFYSHLRRMFRSETDTEKGLANYVEIEVAELQHNDLFDDNLEPILSPTQAGWERGRAFDLQIKGRGTIYGWKIINSCKVPLYPALFYFDNSDWSITSYYQPPTAHGIVDPPLKGLQFLPVGFGDSGSVPHAFFLREGQELDVGFLKLFLSRRQVDLSHIAQPSPFASIGGRYTDKAKLEGSQKLRLHWDAILIPVVQRRADM